MRKFAVIAAVMTSISLGFMWGVATVQYAVWPHSLLKSFKRSTIDGGRSPYWKSRVSVFRTSPRRDVVMLGDSITDICDCGEIENQGIIGDTTAGVLERLDVIETKRPKVVFMLIGFNDIDQRVSVDEAARNYREILTRICNAGATPVAQSLLLPSAAAKQKHLPAIKRLNALIQEHCDSEGIPYIDLNAELAPQGSLEDRFSNDGIHLNGEGCSAWLTLVREFSDDSK